jgi:hypothetical protein
MNAHAPPKEKPPLCGKGLRKLNNVYYDLMRRHASRRCVVCNAPVSNRSLGGHSGRSALTGPLWCLDCADSPRQLLLRLGDGV